MVLSASGPAADKALGILGLEAKTHQETLGWQTHGVLDLENRSAVTVGAQSIFHLIGRSVAQQPCHTQQARWFARDAIASGMALQLVPPADAKVTGDGEKPTVDPAGVGARVPQVLDGRGIGPPAQHRVGPTGRGGPPSNPAIDQADFDREVHVVHGPHLRYSTPGSLQRNSPYLARAPRKP